MIVKPKIMTLFGTRPEAIKMCPLVIKLCEKPFFEHKLCISGQHKEMLDDVLEEFSVTPNYDLEIMKDCRATSDTMLKTAERLTPILEFERPDILLVHGDTSTALGGALAAFYLGIPVGHVEAGLRSFDISSPFPEEFNRITIDKISQLCFAPTRQAEKNLLAEGKQRTDIFVVGNTVIDSLIMSIKRDYRNPLLKALLPNEKSRFFLLTLHRRENIGEPMRNMLRAIRRAVEERENISLLFPVHKNPAVREIVEEILCGAPRIFMTEPMSSTDFRNMLARCDAVLSDSGGIQEEAAFLGKPMLLLRDTTERPEASGNILLTGRSEEGVYKCFTSLLDNQRLAEKMSRPSSAFGDGNASEKIISVLYKYFFD